jgi:hypothetical protein
MMQICTQCKLKKEMSEFNFRNKAKCKKAERCKLCSREAVKKSYRKLIGEKKSQYIRNKNIEAKNRRKKYTQEIMNFKQKRGCIDCGMNNPICLDADHISNKKFNVSDMVKRLYGLDRIFKELEKCEIRCANCHRIKTFLERKLDTKYQISGV